jgi:hypothetical protein
MAQVMVGFGGYLRVFPSTQNLCKLIHWHSAQPPRSHAINRCTALKNRIFIAIFEFLDTKMKNQTAINVKSDI